MAQIRQLGTALSGSTTDTDDREQHQGIGTPEGSVKGSQGDIYRDLDAPALYLKTSGTSTTTGWEILGMQGAQGSTGAQGAAGAQGATGAQGAQGPQG